MSNMMDVEEIVQDMKKNQDLTTWDKFINALNNGETLCTVMCEHPKEDGTDGDCKTCINTASMFIWKDILEEYLTLVTDKKHFRNRNIIRKFKRKYNIDINSEDFKQQIEFMYNFCYTIEKDSQINNVLADKKVEG